jgi:ankyrin repeat protein
MSKETEAEFLRPPKRDFQSTLLPLSSPDRKFPPRYSPTSRSDTPIGWQDPVIPRLPPFLPDIEGIHSPSLHSRRNTIISYDRHIQSPPKRTHITEFSAEWKQALDRGDVEGVRNLIEKGWDVNAPVSEGRAAFLPLIIAARCSPALTELILKAGAAVDGSLGFSGTALQTAIAKRPDETRKEIVQLLLRNGANVNAEAGCRGTALEAATARKDEAMIRLLLDHGADVNQYDGKNYGTALTTAAQHADFSIVKLLLDRGADPNAEMPQGGGNGLLLAIGRLDENMVRLFLERGADCNAKVSHLQSFIRKYLLMPSGTIRYLSGTPTMGITHVGKARHW